MMCPRCDHVNLPGADLCDHCMFALCSLDLPTGQDRVEDSLLHDTVEMLRPRRPVILQSELSLGVALQQMVDAEVGSALIVNLQGKLIGILTERDYLTRVNIQDLRVLAEPICKYMTPHPETVFESDFLGLALYKMDSGGYRHIPVVNPEQEPIAILSVRDVIRHITRLCKEP